MATSDKAATRRALRDRPPVTEAESSDVTTHLRSWLAERPASRVLVYLPMPGEVDVRGAIDDRHRWFVTRTPAGKLPLTVHPIEAPRETHRFGYEQPVPDAEIVDPTTLDVVLTPSLAFDVKGNRIGWGMGYYDGLFASAPQVTAVGITLDRLLVDTLPTEAHDRRMDWLATDSGVRRI
ncbi:MAG: 5-formyltetrahydrofolate cyclo-ligase [Acidimicrobiia bacterium]